MPASNKRAPALAEVMIPAAWQGAVDGIAAGRLGFTVRCTPHRRTVMALTADGTAIFGKLRDQGTAAAATEWHWLLTLPTLGLRTPTAVGLRHGRGGSLVCTAAVPGRSLDALLGEAVAQGRLGAAVAFACRAVAPRVQRLHRHGLVFRDLYWNHLFANGLSPGDEPVFLDVERVFRPRWRWDRWRVKDLAGLWSSAPAGVPARAGYRFLCAYLGRGARAGARQLAVAIDRKAARIRAHAPRYG